MALEMVAGAFLSASLQVLFDRLARPEVVDFLGRRKEFNHVLLKKLKIQLISVNALLNDAEEKQITNPIVKEWLEELEDAAYYADDLLDEIATDALLDKLEADESSGSATSGKVSKNSKKNIPGIEKRMKEILEMVEFIANQKDLLELKVKESAASPSQPTTSLVDESKVYVREEDKEKVLKMLREEHDDSSNLRVIAIVGMGGVGKTTLAQLLYNDDKVKKHFDLKSWVDISERFDISMATKTVLTAVTDDHPASQSSSYDNKDLDWVQNRLKEVLTGKKLLLVFDNVWNRIWEHMSKPFKHVARGSRILITTRHKDVATMIGTPSTPYHLGKLNVDACWKLFAKRAFDDHTVPNVRQNLERKYKEMIVEKCGGLPLAAETLGGLLHYEENDKEWERILNSEILDFSHEDSKIRPVLMLSYSYLPLHLKRCFAFCSIFPKGYEFHKHQLVLLWMVANLLQKPKRNSIAMEEVGYKYFDELASRSFFQESSGGGGESCFVMHDLIHDLAQCVSRGHYFTLEDGNSKQVTMKVRHLVVASHVSDKTFDSVLRTNQLRTLLPSSSNSFDYLSNAAVNQLVSGLKLLRVLSLSWCENFKELPETIGDLKYLLYLDLSNTLVETLPESVGRLYNLQILKLSRCRKITQLPNNMHRLLNLWHLDISGCNNIKGMPRQIGRLKNLQILTGFVVGKYGAKIGELGELSELRGNVCLENLENVANSEDASKARLANKKKLEELTFSWSLDTENPEHHDEVVLEELLSGTELKRLNIIGYRGVEFPNCFRSPNTISSMVSIKLEGCRHCQSLPALGELPLLKTLYIKQLDGVVRVNEEFYGTKGEFTSLESLSFSSMSAWEEWNLTGVGVQDGKVFPRLRELLISDCDRLITVDLPSDLLSLTKLLVIGRNKEAIIQSLLPRTQVLHHLEVGKYKKAREVLQTIDCTGVKSTNETLERSETCVYSFPAGFLSACLTHVEIRNCQNLESFPVHSLPSLVHLDLVACGSLKEIKDAGKSLSLSSLFIKGCPNFISFNEGRLKAPNLNSLTVEGCERLTKLPGQMPYLLPSLKKLWIINCPQVESFPAGGLPSNLNGLLVDKCIKLTAKRTDWNLQPLSALEYFDIRDESDANMESFPENGLLPSCLTSLRIGPLASLVELDMMRFQQFTSLKSLDIQGCPKLTTLKVGRAPEAPKLPKLRCLSIKDCQDFTSFPEAGLDAPDLNSLTVEHCKNLKKLPGRMHDLLPSLERLWIIDCPNAESFPEGGLPSKLKGLLVSNCTSLIKNRNDWNLRALQALEFFDIRDDGSDANVKSFPDKGLLPPTLTWLSIGPLATLKGLDMKELQQLTSLKSLVIKECPKLKKLPRLPASLTCLTINECPALKKRCQREKGKDWNIISHIPRIHIDHEPV